MKDKTYNHPGHALHGRPLIYRETRLVEVACLHGVGHPTPESIVWMDQHGPPGAKGSWGVHGCCGCCTGLTNVAIDASMDHDEIDNEII